MKFKCIFLFPCFMLYAKVATCMYTAPAIIPPPVPLPEGNKQVSEARFFNKITKATTLQDFDTIDKFVIRATYPTLYRSLMLATKWHHTILRQNKRRQRKVIPTNHPWHKN